MNNQIKVIIHNINEEEWGNQIENFLWLLGNDIEIYTSVDKNNKEIGQIIFEDYLKNKVYVKGIFVQIIKEKDLNNDKNKDIDENKVIPGINANLKLDRDRNCIQNDWELKTLIANIISGTFNKNIEFLKDIQQHNGNAFAKTEFGYEKVEGNGNGTITAGLKKLTPNLINCLEAGNIINYYQLGEKLAPESIDIIWNEMDSRPGNKNKQPTEDASKIVNFIEEKKLPEQFYPFYNVNYELMQILEKSPLYKDIKKNLKNMQKILKMLNQRKNIKLPFTIFIQKFKLFCLNLMKIKLNLKNLQQ